MIQLPFNGLTLSILVAILLSSAIAMAQNQNPPKKQNHAAFLFAYYPKEGMSKQFNEGYKRHLDWHRKHKDPLVWYAWYVVFGERIGLFIDGSFGSGFDALDKRILPLQDQADFAQTTEPFANPVFRMAYTLRSDLSIATPLENLQPSKFVHVNHFEIRPGHEEQFEKVVLGIKEYLESVDGAPGYTWYELTVGGATPNYMLMITLNGWSNYPEVGLSLEKTLLKAYDTNKARSFLEMLSFSVAQQKSEVWSYQPELSYFPENNKQP